MHWNDYMWFMMAMLVCMLLSALASSKVKTTFEKHDKVRCRSGVTGYDAVARLMRANGVNGISIGCVKGNLTDHYHPTKSIVNLSESTYGSNSVAAVAVAAHEMGHVMQKQNGYAFYRFRTALVPVVNFGSRLAMPLVLVGLLLDWYSATANPDIGFKVAMIGVTDISLLPIIADYFGVSVDYLIGHDTSKQIEEINNTCAQVSKLFSEKRYMEAIPLLREMLIKHPGNEKLMYNLA